MTVDAEAVRLPLYGRGKVILDYVLVDAADAERLVGERLGLFIGGGGHRYAFVRRGGKRPVFLHRELLGLPAQRERGGGEGDHINRNTLDNRRANLRVVTHAQNMQNRPSHKGSTSPLSRRVLAQGPPCVACPRPTEWARFSYRLFRQ